MAQQIAERLSAWDLCALENLVAAALAGEQPGEIDKMSLHALNRKIAGAERIVVYHTGKGK